ncbi:MAG: hypothetical protein NVS4B3_09620 [Gemmatimonadaceae bacterium]
MPRRVSFTLVAFSALSLVGSLGASRALAQQKPAKPAPADSEETSAPADPLSYGFGLGAVSYGQGRASQSASLILQYKALPWLTIATNPSYARSEIAMTRSVSMTGITDLPVSISAAHEFSAPLTPSLEAALGLTLPTGDSASGFGSGSMGYSAELGGGFAPAEGWNVALGAGKSFSGADYVGSYGLGSATSLSGSASYEFSERVTGNFGLNTEIGGTAGQGSGAVEGGFTIPVAKPLALTIDLSRGFGTGAPQYTFAIGFGTAVGGISPASLASPFRLLRTASKTAAGGSGRLAAYCTRTGRC